MALGFGCVIWTQGLGSRIQGSRFIGSSLIESIKVLSSIILRTSMNLECNQALFDGSMGGYMKGLCRACNSVSTWHLGVYGVIQGLKP